MELKRRVALNNVQLDAVDSRICISSVEPGDGKENISAVDAAAGYGQRITGNRRSMVDMVVKFRIHEKGKTTAGLQARSEVLEKVNAWAAPGGALTVNYRPGRRLNVILAQAPGEGSLWDFTKEFQITFRAYAIPFWEDNTQSSKQIDTDASGETTITTGGSAKTQIDFTMLNTSGSTINTASITAGGQTMTFADLGLANGETLTIDHTADGLLRIRILGTGGAYRSAMAARSGANDFLIDAGTRTVSYSAGGNCTVTAVWRARYL